MKQTLVIYGEKRDKIASIPMVVTRKQLIEAIVAAGIKMSTKEPVITQFIDRPRSVGILFKNPKPGWGQVRIVVIRNILSKHWIGEARYELPLDWTH